MVYERDENTTTKRNWSMGLHWAVGALQYLTSEELFARIQDTQVNPNIPTNDADQLPFINGQTGKVIGELKSDKFYRLRRDKFRALLMEGLDVRWGKDIGDISYSADGRKITARFADGTEDTGSLLIASDCPHSAVRTLLVGSEKAKVTPIDFAATMCFSKHSRDKALFLRSKPHHPLYQAAPHPNGYFAWLSLHDGDDPIAPENWTFFHYISFPEPRTVPNNRSMAEHLAHQKELAKQFADPFKSVFEWMPDDSQVWYGKLRHWDPSEPEHRWDNHDGRVTLAGDAAHPMTFQRGQGLNHAIMDSFQLCKGIEMFWNSGDFSSDQRTTAITDYESEMIPRGGEEVRLSEANSIAMHDWDLVSQSPIMKQGMRVSSQAT